MQSNDKERRRRTRVPLSVPVIVTTLDQHIKLQETCETLDISSGGAQLRLSRAVPTGTRIRLDILNCDRVTKGWVVRSVPYEKKGWGVGVQLIEQTGNFWGISTPPKDWEESRSLRRGDEMAWIKDVY
jgi:hypothetical protein